MLLMIVYTVGLAFIEEERRYPAWNYIVLGLFTLSQGFLVFVLSVTFDTGMVMFVLVLATFLTLMLCIFNVQTRTAFDYRSGIIYVCVIMVILFPLTALLGFRQPTLIVTFVLVYGVVLLFGIYIVFDMHLIVNRAHLFEYSPDEYIFATLNFYTGKCCSRFELFANIEHLPSPTDIVMLTLAIISNVLERAQQQQQQPKTAAPAQPRRKSSPTRKSLSRTRRSRSPPQKNQTSKGKTTADTSSSKTTTPNT